jgi:hypothetical protein
LVEETELAETGVIDVDINLLTVSGATALKVAKETKLGEDTAIDVLSTVTFELIVNIVLLESLEVNFELCMIFSEIYGETVRSEDFEDLGLLKLVVDLAETDLAETGSKTEVVTVEDLLD